MVMYLQLPRNYKLQELNEGQAETRDKERVSEHTVFVISKQVDDVSPEKPQSPTSDESMSTSVRMCPQREQTSRLSG